MKLTTIALLLFATTALAGAPSSLQQLPAGDTLEVSYSSSGCFHFQMYEFEFQRGEAVTATITRVIPGSQDAKGRKTEAKRVALGTLTLTKDEVTGLDRLLAFYRSKPEGGCTTIDQITLKQKRGEKPVATEAFTDASCGTYELKNVTLLSSLAEKLTKKEK